MRQRVALSVSPVCNTCVCTAPRPALAVVEQCCLSCYRLIRLQLFQVFGAFVPGGRMPITIYDPSEPMQPMTDYDMTSGLGRTYRYYTGKTVYPFGAGLSFWGAPNALQVRAFVRSCLIRIIHSLCRPISPPPILQVSTKQT